MGNFDHFKKPSKDQLKEIWDEAIFVFDTNVFLQPYRSSDELAILLLNTIKRYAENNRLFIPYQVAFEFHKNRFLLIADLLSTDSFLSSRIKNLVDGFNQSIETLHNDINKKPHVKNLYGNSLLSVEEIVNKATIEINALKLNKATKLSGIDFENDYIIDELEPIFDSFTSEKWDTTENKKRESEIEKRYKNSIPPGYMDAGKSDNSLGDCKIWFQIIDFAIDKKCNVIFVTNDNKDDWWWREKRKTIGPNWQLREEFKRETGYDFYMYSLDQFLKINEENSSSEEKIDQDVFKEASNINITNENSLVERLASANGKLANKLFSKLDDIGGEPNENSNISKYGLKLNSTLYRPLIKGALNDNGKVMYLTMKNLFGDNLNAWKIASGLNFVDKVKGKIFQIKDVEEIEGMIYLVLDGGSEEYEYMPMEEFWNKANLGLLRGL